MGKATLNTAKTSSAASGNDVTRTPNYGSIWTTDSTPVFLFDFSLSGGSALTTGQTVNIAANAFSFTLTSTAFNAATEQEALKGMFGASRTLKIHYGDPGTNGTANTLTTLGDISLAASNWTYSAS